jgi:replicative DNA helicase
VSHDSRHIPPQCVESEMAILGAICVDASTIDVAHGIISAEDFYRESHRKIFKAMAVLCDKSEPVDLVTLTQALKAAGDLEEVGGGAYLYTLVEYVPTAANIAYYCKIVADKAAKRRLLQSTLEAAAMIHEDKSVYDVASHLETAIFQPGKSAKGEPQGSADLLRHFIKTLEIRHERKGNIQGIPYGIEALDEATDGMHLGELIIIAGRPSMGKSSFAGNILANVCSSGLAGMLFTMEMSSNSIMDRQVASVGKICYTHIRNGQLFDTDWARVMNASSTIHNWQFFVDDTPAISLREIRSKAKRRKREGLDLIVVDYLQLMALSSKESRTQAIGEVSRGLKQLARELDIPVIALSQLSRNVDSRTDKRPVMSDLRDSGEIEQDADVILFPYRPAAYCQKCKDRVDDHEHDYQEHQAKAEIIIEKQRDGERNISIPVAWRGEHQRFYGV